MFDIIVPTYRIRPAWLEECLQSIQCQTVDTWQCYIVDGTPEDWPLYDELMSVVDSYLSDGRFTYLRQTGQGVSQARNQGIEAGNNSLIAFLDGDDYWYNEHLIEFVRAVDEEPLGVIYWTAADCYIELVFPKTGEKHRTHRISSHIIDYDLKSPKEQHKAICLSPIMTSQVVILRKDFEILDFGFDTGLCLGEDQDLWLRLLALRNRGVQIPAVTGEHRAHADQTTQGGQQLGGLDSDRIERLERSKEIFRERHDYYLSGNGLVRDAD
jgi:glycosyltransferase involved in cell wall biosynthesis